MKSNRYREAGVDIDLGDRLVDLISPAAKRTARRGLVGGIGGFGGVFSTKLAGYKDPLLVSGTDGVGTKLKVAQMMGAHGSVGIDLVAMCVNDVLTLGAEPLFFLDYYATGKLKLKIAVDVINGIAKGCKIAGCALLGGETAEMPGFYSGDEYDLAGFAVGAVERGKTIDGKKIRPGDAVIGIASSGLHSNGYSLARRIFFDKMKLKPGAKIPGLKSSIGAELIRPTKIFVKPVLAVLKKHTVNGMAHITGGGITGNLPRVLRKGIAAYVDRTAWRVPPIFGVMAENGDVSEEEMFETFNMGIGYILVAPKREVAGILKTLKSNRERGIVIGEIIKSKGEPEVVYERA